MGTFGCAEDAGDDSNSDKQDQQGDLSGIPTPGLRMLAEIGDQETFERMFHASSVDRDNTMSMVRSELDKGGTGQLSIKGEGIPVFTENSPFGAAVSEFARNVWSGKQFTFVVGEDGSLTATLENAIFGFDFVKADVTINSLAGAMTARNEEDPGADLAQFGQDHTVEVDSQNSVIIDYKNDVLGIFNSLIDEIRPVTAESLAAAGVQVPAGVDISDLWIGRATALFGIFNRERKFVLYFALDFDRDGITFGE